MEASSASPVIVFAGPGTGKTTVIIARVVKLLREGFGCALTEKRTRILVLTFSKPAQEELETKLKAVVCMVCELFLF